METPNIRLKVEKFRAINKADIVINGITLVAGENGSGKSSLSKLLYFYFRTVGSYEAIVRRKLELELNDVFRFIDIASQELVTWNKKDIKAKNEFRKGIIDLKVNIYDPDESLENTLHLWQDTIDKLEVLYLDYDKDNLKNTSSTIYQRLEFIIRDVIKNQNEVTSNTLNFGAVKHFIDLKFNNTKNIIEKRPLIIFEDELRSVFSDGELPNKLEIQELGDVIVSTSKKYLSIPYTVQNAFYIDTPMIVGTKESSTIQWGDLNGILEMHIKENNNYSNLINKEIINGESYREDNVFSSNKLKFKRSDGQIFNLLDVATGIKSFSILQLLLNNGLLNDKTLLIIDEPESHLHPQWIVEYARIIVLLNKELGVKFFLASHNPDFVSAIRYISEKEGTLETTNFYLAKESKIKFQYDYKDLKKNIEPIFESFNISLDKISEYGA